MIITPIPFRSTWTQHIGGMGKKLKLLILIIVIFSLYFFMFHTSRPNISSGSNDPDASKNIAQQLYDEFQRLLKSQGTRQPMFDEEALVRMVIQEAAWLQRDTCLPVNNIGFLKIHKCASSTIQNMLMRYGEKHDLTFAMPSQSHIFPLSQPFNASFVHEGAPHHTDRVNIFTMHAVWNKKEVSKVLHTTLPPIYITVIREPSEAFISLFDYFAFETFYKMPLAEFVATNGVEMKRFMGCLSFNVMACDMGARPGDYMNPKAIKMLTHQIDYDFDLVLVAERFEESLVLMKHLLCWSYDDVISLNVNARYKKKDRLTPVVSDMLADRLKPDYYIYKHFTSKFDLLVKAFGEERMAVEVQKLKDITRAKLDECNIIKLKPKDADGPEKAGSSKVDRLVTNSTDPMCMGIIRPEQAFVGRLKDKQAKMLAKRNLLV